MIRPNPPIPAITVSARRDPTKSSAKFLKPRATFQNALAQLRTQKNTKGSDREAACAPRIEDIQAARAQFVAVGPGKSYSRSKTSTSGLLTPA
jgi:hypothetical protein